MTAREAMRAYLVWLLAAFLLFITIGGALILVGVVNFRTEPDLIKVWIVSLIAAAFLPKRGWVAQWELTLDDRAPAADAAYASIGYALQTRSIPVSVIPQRIAVAQHGGVGNYLTIRQLQYVAYVSVFSYGTGLFLSWSMWRKQRLAGVVFRFLKERVLVLVGKSTDFDFHIASDRPRAMREAVHNAVREGVEAVLSHATTPPLEQVFGALVVEGTPIGAPTAPSFGVPGPGTPRPIAAQVAVAERPSVPPPATW